MVLLEQDYRFCVRMSLQILQEMRAKLRETTEILPNDIRIALHTTGEYEKSRQQLYFEKYYIQWLNKHWSMMCEILEQHTEYSIEQRKDITIFFASYFKNFFEQSCKTQSFSHAIIPNILDIKGKSIEKMIECSDKWEENSKELRADEAVWKEKYDELLKKYSKENQ